MVPLVVKFGKDRGCEIDEEDAEVPCWVGLEGITAYDKANENVLIEDLSSIAENEIIYFEQLSKGKSLIITKVKIFLSIFFFLGVISILRGQEIEYDGYDIVPLIIYQDTVPDKNILRLFHMRIISGKTTERDSINYVQRLKTRPLLLVQKANNRFVQKELAEQYLDNKEISQYIGRELLLETINRTGPDLNHPEKLKEKGIELISEKPKTKTHHYFSTPLLIEENRFIISHFKSVGRGVGKSEFIIYCYDENGTIRKEKEFVIWEH